MKRFAMIAVGAAMASGTGFFQAQEAVLTKTVTEQSLAMQYEIQAAQAAIDTCTAEGFAPVVVIIDARNATKLVMVADGGQYGFTEEARRKAYTAVTLRATTADTQRSILANPKRLIPPDSQLLIAGGGAPFFAGKQLIGAIGVDGGGSPALEDKCARAGVDKLKDYLHPEPPQQGGPQGGGAPAGGPPR